MATPDPERAPKALELVPILPPPAEQRRRRMADFADKDTRRGRYHLPESLHSGSPVGYRHRIPLTRDEAAAALRLLAMPRPTSFAPAPPPTEQELFEECSLGVLTARQSTNYQGHRDILLGPADTARLASLMGRLEGLDAPVLDGATHSHVVLCRPYRTPFTFLLTFIGHRPFKSLLTVPIRAWRKRFEHIDDIPTIAWLMHIHLGVLADAMERATVIASGDTRRAQVFVRPFCGPARAANREVLGEIEQIVGMTPADRAAGWRIALVAQVGGAAPGETIGIDAATLRKLGANQLAFRSERIQPGVNHEEKAPPQYHARQDMDVPDELTVQAGRAAYNAFAHWTGCTRECAKRVLLLERIDVLTPNGKQRIREVREMLDAVTDHVMNGIPLWADLPTGKRLSGNAARGKKAFALAGQRIYIGGLSNRVLAELGLPLDLAARAFGAAAARSSLVAELMGVVDLPEDCDLLAGICLMAGPVNQNDIGKAFYGQNDLLAREFPNDDPTSLLVWTLKAKTVADPIGNEEQLLNAARKGALVDLRPAPHEVIRIRSGGAFLPMRRSGERTNQERAFADAGNFVTSPEGREIPGNRGSAWPRPWSSVSPWAAEVAS